MSNLGSLLLSDEQRDRYLQLLAKHGLANSAARKIHAGVRPARIPLSTFQEPLWFMNEYLEGDAAHNVVYPMGLPAGDIDERALAGALERMIQSHEVLRTTFTFDGTHPFQVVQQTMPVVLQKVDLSTLPEQQREPAGWKLIEDEAKRVFDLTTGPLIVFTLLKVEPGKSVLIVSLHHIICDTWSVAIIDRDIRSNYDDILNARAWTRPAPTLQFPDYAIWQQQQCEQDRYREDLKFWTETLKNAPVLPLQTDRPIPQRRRYLADNSLVLIDAALLERAKRFAQQNGVTLYMVLLAAFKMMLQRHSGLDDITVGTPHANREHPDIQEMIGFTLNSLALRSDLSGNPTFRSLVQRIKRVALSAYEHHQVPFPLVLEALDPGTRSQGLSRHSLFRVFFSVQNIDWAEGGPAQIDVRDLHSKPRFTVPHPITKYDLYMYMRERDGLMLGGLEYDRELFDRTRIERMIAHFKALLADAVQRPDVRIRQLSYLRAGEREFESSRNGVSKGGAVEDDLVSEFDRCALRHAHVTAILGPNPMSYAQLSEASNRLAHALIARGVAAEVNVGLLADRTSSMVVAILAILKAGGCCVPMDVSSPIERIEQLLRTARLKTVIYDPALIDASALAGDMISLRDDFSSQPNTAPRTKIHPQQSAFVFFTSGSTGLPTAVVLSHRGVLSAQRPDRCAHDMEERARFLVTTPVSSARLPGELLWPLFSGASLALALPGGHQDPVYLGDTIKSLEISHFNATPQILQELTQREIFKGCGQLRLVYCVGDRLEAELARQFAQQCGAVLCNSYAQTEACPVAFGSSAELASDSNDNARFLAVGSNAPNTQLYLLDSNLEPAPTGVSGEIFVGGDNLSRGYLDDPRLTAASYVPDMYGPPGARLYRTGDFGRLDARGILTLCGRRDQRIKIMSYRVDLSEIERMLLELPGISTAVVLANDEDDNLSIVAFVQGSALATKAAKLSEKDIQMTLARKLPFYMVPSQICAIETFPLGRTGKIDRMALLEIARTRRQDLAAAETPSTEVEKILCEIWSEALEIPEESIGIYATLFELGGQSIMVTRIANRIRERLGIKIKVRDIFEAATVAALADLIEAQRMTA
jgi:amino acid adenylation domain-containing protein